PPLPPLLKSLVAVKSSFLLHASLAFRQEFVELAGGEVACLLLLVQCGQRGGQYVFRSGVPARSHALVNDLLQLRVKRDIHVRVSDLLDHTRARERTSSAETWLVDQLKPLSARVAGAVREDCSAMPRSMPMPKAMARATTTTTLSMVALPGESQMPGGRPPGPSARLPPTTGATPGAGTGGE